MAHARWAPGGEDSEWPGGAEGRSAGPSGPGELGPVPSVSRHGRRGLFSRSTETAAMLWEGAGGRGGRDGGLCTRRGQLEPQAHRRVRPRHGQHRGPSGREGGSQAPRRVSPSVPQPGSLPLTVAAAATPCEPVTNHNTRAKL